MPSEEQLKDEPLVKPLEPAKLVPEILLKAKLKNRRNLRKRKR